MWSLGSSLRVNEDVTLYNRVPPLFCVIMPLRDHVHDVCVLCFQYRLHIQCVCVLVPMTWSLMALLLFLQTGCRLSKPWWSSLWASPLSPSWSSWVSSSPCLKEGSSISQASVRFLQVLYWTRIYQFMTPSSFMCVLTVYYLRGFIVNLEKFSKGAFTLPVLFLLCSPRFHIICRLSHLHIPP